MSREIADEIAPTSARERAAPLSEGPAPLSEGSAPSRLGADEAEPSRLIELSTGLRSPPRAADKISSAGGELCRSLPPKGAGWLSVRRVTQPTENSATSPPAQFFSISAYSGGASSGFLASAFATPARFCAAARAVFAYQSCPSSVSRYSSPGPGPLFQYVNA